MVKSYLKFDHSVTFGIITSSSSNIISALSPSLESTTSRKQSLGRVYVPANENVVVWDVKSGQIIAKWTDDKCSAVVTAIAQNSANTDVFAAGYGDGSVRLWDAKVHALLLTFNGHRSTVTKLAFDEEGVRLASGSKDTDIIIWDLVSETGLCKLKGHKDQITGLQFVKQSGPENIEIDDSADLNTDVGLLRRNDHLVSTSKDSLIKLWNVETKYCLETHIAQPNSECWALGVSSDHAILLTSGNHGELTLWTLNLFKPVQLPQGEGGGASECLIKRGVMQRHGKDRTIGLQFDSSNRYMAVHGLERAVEIYKIRTDAELRKLLARKRKRKREKENASQKGLQKADAVETVGDSVDLSDASVEDMFTLIDIVRPGGRVFSFSWIQSPGAKYTEILVGATCNELEVYRLAVEKPTSKSKAPEKLEHSKTVSVNLPGHRTDIRALALSSDDQILASASNGTLKTWNIQTQNCLRTFECGYALCIAFLPGDGLILIGTKSGHLEIFEVTSASMIESIQAHDGAIWTLAVHPDGKSIVTGSADKTVKFWELKNVSKTTKLVPKRHLKLSNDVLSVRITPDARLIAVALLDYTVKVFFVDSLKLFLNLYGHKLPVLSMDISYDSKLLVTCSADKDVRIWGLDFGDCHKAIFAHQDSILQVAFMPNDHEGNGHHFFSASKDKLVKYWDGDKFQQIQKLEGHHGEIWALQVSHAGDFIVSASHDKSIKVWRQTEEQLFLEEERERELEEIYETTLTASLDRNDDQQENEREIVQAGKQTVQTLMAGERIIEAIEVGIEDYQAAQEWQAMKDAGLNPPAPARNPLFMALGGISAERHVLSVVQKIQPAALQDALLVLPFTHLPALFTFVEAWLRLEWNLGLTCRILFFLINTHHKQIVSSKSLRLVLDRIRTGLRTALQTQKNEIGFNLAGLNFVKRTARDIGVKNYVDDITEVQEELGVGSRKRVFVDIA